MPEIIIDAEALLEAAASKIAFACIKDPKFVELCAKTLIGDILKDQGYAQNLQDQMRQVANERIAQMVQALDSGLNRVKDEKYREAQGRLEKSYQEGVANYVRVHLTDNELRELALQAVSDSVRRAFGRTAHKLAREVLERQDRIELLLGDTLGESMDRGSAKKDGGE